MPYMAEKQSSGVIAVAKPEIGVEPEHFWRSCRGLVILENFLEGPIISNDYDPWGRAQINANNVSILFMDSIEAH